MYVYNVVDVDFPKSQRMDNYKYIFPWAACDQDDHKPAEGKAWEYTVSFLFQLCIIFVCANNLSIY